MSSLRRLALVCEPPDGGAAEQLTQLATGLRAHGYEPTVIGPPDFFSGERLAAADVAFWPISLARGYSRPDRDLRAFSQLVQLLRGGRFELVHAHAAKAGVLARIACRIRHLPVIYSPHCLPFAGDVTAARRLFGVSAERGLARVTDALICVCEAERAQTSRARIRPRTEPVVVYNGCADCRDIPQDPSVADLRRQGPVVGAVTVLRQPKRLDVLLAAWPRVQAAHRSARLAIVGDGPARAALQAEAGRSAIDASFLPFRPPSARALQALDLYVLPSAREALPIGILEAQACGVPQIVTDIGGNAEAVTHETGIVVPIGDSAALADAIIDLLGDDRRRDSMGRASRARYLERFTAERMVAETAAVYDRVLRCQ